MAARVVVHVGPRKTATTYLQRALAALVLDGALDPSVYPVSTRGRLDHNQVPGLIDLARSVGEIGLQDDAWAQQDGSDAQALLDAVQRAPGEVIVSAEALSVLPLAGARHVIEALGPAPVDVIVTARDLGRVLPSSWQQHMRNGNFESYLDYLALRREERISLSYRTELRRGFWRAYRYADLARRWREAGARQVHLVTVPAAGSDPSLVWQRFVQAAQIANLPATPPEVPLDRANISLTAAETYALCGFNRAARAAGQGRRDVRATHRALIRRGWLERSDRGPRLGLPLDLRAEVGAWSEEDREDLTAAPVTVCGDLQDLRPSVDDRAALPDPDEVARAAGAAMHLLSARRTTAEPEASD